MHICIQIYDTICYFFDTVEPLLVALGIAFDIHMISTYICGLSLVIALHEFAYICTLNGVWFLCRS